MTQRTLGTWIGIVWWLGAASMHAAEITSNGTGGGLWTDPSTWQGKVAPGAQDDVVIRKFDVVHFDRNDEDKVSCHKLQLDPKGVLLFKTGTGKAVCCVADALDNFGIIKLDGTKSAGDYHELRLLGATPEQRKIKLNKGASLLLYGMANLPDGRRNVALVSQQPPEAKDPGLVEADGQVMLDWQRAHVRDVKLAVKGLDNTGAKPNERINLIDNVFAGQARIWCHSCDTPVIARNALEFKGDMPLQEAAIGVLYCPLAEIKGNSVRGGFLAGISVNYQSDSVLIDNTVEKCTLGITGGYGIPNTMIKNCTVRACPTGIKLEGATGVVEDTVVEGAATAFHTQNATLQLTNLQVKDLAKGGVALLHEGNALTLLNCNILPAQIKLGAQPAAQVLPPVTALHYVVVRVKTAPADAQIDIRSNPPPAAEAMDPNVRNTPAPVVGGLTPLPRTLNPLIVKAWTLDAKGKVSPAPEYTVTVLGAAPKEGAQRPVLHKMMFRPMENAFRVTPLDATPTLEVLVK